MSPPTAIPTLVPATLPAVTPTPVVAVEPEPTSVESEPASPEELALAGEEVFEQFCAVCHSLTSEVLVGPGLEQLFNRDQLPNGEPFSEEGLKAWIVTGGGAMPGMPLTEEQLEAVVVFLREATQP
jgi:mono/diheme cytochrome c family protein